MTAGCRRLIVLIAGLGPDSAFVRRGKAWTLSNEVNALGTETLAHMWGEDLPEQLLAHPDRPKPADNRRRSSDPAVIKRFLLGR